MNKYQIIIWWSKEDNRFIAEVPELEGCMADGDTVTEAVKEIETSINLWLEVARDRGIPIPEPKGRIISPSDLHDQQFHNLSR
ncbi:MAG: type II toxin-antitoxin system HicB family antitoxin [Lachnospiraceae bacterium]|nr:type II toxin-antitoxin system HicB family antitoxin [Lachnospiraceae bacterium]